MPERGRPAASSGNAYHDVRVATWLVALLQDATVTSVAVETLDATDDLVVQRSDGTVRYEQVKERAPNGSWTAPRLTREGVLQQFLRQHRLNPQAEFALFTGSDASDFREVAERARNASANHGNDESGREAALTEWQLRLAARRDFVDQILSRIPTEHDHHAVTWQELHALLARVYVLDAQGTIDQLRDSTSQRLRLLVDNPARALDTLEGLAREAAIRRGVIRRRAVETALARDGSGPRLTAFVLAIDNDAYADRLQHESAAVDIAQLPPLAPHFDSPSGLSFDLDAVRGTTLLVGGHGTGKSRIAAELAVQSVRAGRRCLHTRLARWATNLRDLVVAELSRAVQRQARPADIDSLFHDDAVLVLDGLDEVPAAHRLTAEREVLQFADSHPRLNVLVTCRPGSGRILSQEWPVIEPRALSYEQITTALGRNPHTLGLPEPIIELARNPLMLGLLLRTIASGARPTTEADLLDAFIAEIVRRESQRIPSIDGISGQRLAEEAAFEWLSSGRIALEENQFRSMTTSVAMNLRHAAFLQTDATQVEHWLIEAGLCVKLGAVFVPVHRAVLDHLAGRSMARRDPILSAGLPELREAVARHLGSHTQVTEPMLALLTAVGTDLELLARGRRLSSPNIIWPFDPARFATEYLAELRRLSRGPLFDVGVVGRAIEIDLDREITWIAERDREGSGDVATIVPTPARLYISAPDGSNRTPVQAFTAQGRRGAEIDIRVPHFAAFARAGEELQHLLQQRALPHEGPDMIYERLCSFTERFLRTVTQVYQRDYHGYSDADFRGLTALELQAQFWNYVSGIAGDDVPTTATFIAFVPSSRTVVVSAGPETAVLPPLSPLGVHSATLTRLVATATRFGIQELPLHPLALVPNSATDPVLSLPGRRRLLHEDSLSLYIERHELGEIRAFRYLVEHNLRGLDQLLPTYSTLPWRIDVAIEDLSTSTTFDVRTRASQRHAPSDEVRVVSNISDSSWTRSSSILAYSGVLRGAYDLLESDVRNLLSGTNPLGSHVL